MKATGLLQLSPSIGASLRQRLDTLARLASPPSLRRAAQGPFISPPHPAPASISAFIRVSSGYQTINRSPIATGLNFPIGLAEWRGDLYVSQNGYLQGPFDGTGEVVKIRCHGRR